MLTYICIDDTDEIGSAVSTGALAEEIAKFVGLKFAPTSFISRHQLCIDESINYTSHNSSMCFTAEISKKENYGLIDFVRNLLIAKSVKSSSPGFAIFSGFSEKLIKFGMEAKVKVLTKDMAFSLAKDEGVYLEGLQNGGLGTIGALAGIGLRMSGNDGRIKGKVKFEKHLLSVAEILANPLVESILDEDFHPINKDEIVVINDPLKLIVWDHKATLLLKKDGANFSPLKREDIREF